MQQHQQRLIAEHNLSGGIQQQYRQIALLFDKPGQDRSIPQPDGLSILFLFGHCVFSSHHCRANSTALLPLLA